MHGQIDFKDFRHCSWSGREIQITRESLVIAVPPMQWTGQKIVEANFAHYKNIKITQQTKYNHYNYYKFC